MLGQTDGTSGMLLSGKGGTARGLGNIPSELATEVEERSVRSSRTPNGGAEAGIECCRCLPDWRSLWVDLHGGAVWCTLVCRGA